MTNLSVNTNAGLYSFLCPVPYLLSNRSVKTSECDQTCVVRSSYMNLVSKYVNGCILKALASIGYVSMCWKRLH